MAEGIARYSMTRSFFTIATSRLPAGMLSEIWRNSGWSLEHGGSTIEADQLKSIGTRWLGSFLRYSYRLPRT